jgi:biotin carboxyl carrier protein
MEIKCRAGERVKQAQELILVETMKMEATIAAPDAGTIRSVEVAVGDAIREGQIVVRFE